MLSVSEEIFQFFTANSTFTDEVSQRIFPLVAENETEFPFAIYRINEQQGETKDGDRSIITLLLYYKQDQFTECVTFADSCKEIIKNKYDWVSSSVDYIEENQSFVASINFEIT